MNKTVTVRNRKSRAKDKAAALAVETLQALEPPPVDLLRAMIAEAAYYRAERRGFAPGHELEDWLIAEIELNARIETQAPRNAVSGRDVH
jgi:hypothetical protein